MPVAVKFQINNHATKPRNNTKLHCFLRTISCTTAFGNSDLRSPHSGVVEVFAATDPECNPPPLPLAILYIMSFGFIILKISKEFWKYLDLMMRLSGEGSCIRAAPLYLSLDYWNAHSCLPTLLISNSDATQYFNGYVSKETNSVWDLVFFGIVAAKMGCKSSSTTGTKIAGTLRWQRSSQNHAKNILKYIHNVHSRARRQVAGHLVINIAPSRTKSDMNNFFSHYYILPHQCI